MKTIDQLAADWNVQAASITAIGATRNGAAWHFPERDAEGTVIGTARRFDNGEKGFVAGGRRGLTMVWPLPDDAGMSRENPIVVVEGQSDAATGIDMGLVMIGRPSATGGTEHLTKLLKERHVLIVGENDAHAGQHGANLVAAALVPVAASVRIIYPPEGVKDLREWHSAPAPCNRDEVLSCARAVENVQIRALPLGRDRARIEIVPASALGSGDPADWLWHGWLARGHITLMIGLWKAGKTTLLSHLLKASASGGDIAGAIRPIKVLVVVEEGSAMWAQRRDRLGISDNVHFIVRPFTSRASQAMWVDLIGTVTEHVKSQRCDVVVIDTFQSVNPCRDENDAAEMMGALSPLHDITEAGAAVLLLHHPRKGDSTEAQASRGSGALPGFVDIIVELRRYDAQHQQDRRRTLKGYSRFDETPGEVVVELTDDGYRVVGSRGDAKQSDRLDALDGLLTETPLTAEEVSEVWLDNGIPKPSKRTVQADLTAGAVLGRWQREGDGVKGSPYRYFKRQFDSRTPPPLGAGNESEPDVN